MALAAEIPEPGCFERTFLGERPAVVSRTDDGTMALLVSRCARRGVRLCRERRGRTRELVCPCHRWACDLAGNVIRAPFRRGGGAL